MVRRREWAVLGALLLAVASFNVYVARGQWFFGDDWEFLTFRGIFGTHKLGLLTPHNEHWSTLPILAYRAVFSLVGIKTYWPYMAMLVGVHAACVGLLWRVIRRTPGVTPELALGAAAILGFFGAGWEDLLWAFQIGFLGSVVAGLALVLAVDREGSRRRVIAVAVGSVVSLMISGISVVMVGVVGLVALIRWGWRKALFATVPAGVIYLVWLQRYGQDYLERQSNLHGTLADAPRYVFDGIVATVQGAIGGSRNLSIVLVVTLAVVAATRLRSLLRDAPEAVALALGAAALFAVISQGRAAVVDPATSRYLYISAALLLPIVAVLVSRLVERWTWTRVVSVVAAAAVVFHGADFLAERARGERNNELALRGQMIAALDLADSGIRILSDEPQSPSAPDVSIAHLRSMRARGKLFTQPTNARDRAGAKLALQARFSTASTRRPLGDVVAFNTAGVKVSPGENGCADITGADQAMFVRLGPRNAFTVRTDRRALVQVWYGYEGGFAGPRRVFAEPDKTYTFVSDLTGELAILLDRGVTTLCGVALRQPG